MAYIMDSGQKTLNTTFCNIYSYKSAMSADLLKNQNFSYFEKKKRDFLIENQPRGVKTGPMGKPRQSQVRVNIPHKCIITDLSYHIFDFSLIFYLTCEIRNTAKKQAKKLKSLNPKTVIVGLWGMFTRTWDYRGFPIGPVLTPLGQIFDLKIAFFFQNMTKIDF